MQDFGGGLGSGFSGGFGAPWLAMAETLGLAMARRAAEILDRHRDVLIRAGAANQDAAGQGADGEYDAAQFALDDAVFTAVLDGVNCYLGRFDERPSDDRWCDALLHLLALARYAAESA